MEVKQYTLILFQQGTLQPFAEHVYNFDCPNGVSVEAYLKEEFPSYENMNCILFDNAVNEYGNTHDRRFNTIQLKTIKTHKPITMSQE